MLLLSLFVLAFIFYTAPVWANPACAVCTVGVVVGLEVARNLGVDDGVIAIWAGALLALIGYWTILWFEKKGWSFKFRNELIMLISLSMILGVYIKDLVYTPKPILFFYIDPTGTRYFGRNITSISDHCLSIYKIFFNTLLDDFCKNLRK